MRRSFTFIAVLVIVAATIAGGLSAKSARRRSASNSNSTATSPADKYEADRIENDYREAIATVEDRYAGEVDYEKATQAAIQGMLFTLDPHSVYFPAPEFKKLKEDQASSFYGIGVQIVRHDDGVYIQSVVEGTPASRAGLRYGDRIVEVDGKDARDWSSDQVSKNVRGARGESVLLKVERAGQEAAVQFKIVRDAVPLPSIRNAFMLSPGTGYIGLVGGFQHTTDDELRDSISGLKREGMRQLVLDLRNNPGGLLDQAVKVCEKFLPRNQLVVSTEGRDAKQKAEYRATGRDRHPSVPIVILVNYGSASASEIVAGCLQDATSLGVCKAIVVGEQTFGKGSVQSILPLQDGSALRLTTAKYYTPSHKVIHEKGITPDIVVPMSDEEEENINLRRVPGGIDSLDVKLQDRVRNARDVQLDRAMDLLKGISLYTKRTPAGEKRVAKGDKVAAATK